MAVSRNTGVTVAFFFIAVLVYASMLGGAIGVVGYFLGVGGGVFSLSALWWAIKLAGKTMRGEQSSPFGAFLIVLAFFVKLPLYMALGSYAKTLGEAASTCFVAGLCLVYFSLFGWGLTQR